MIPSFRWFGPGDPVALSDIRQAGAAGVVSSLHHLPCGALWSGDEVIRRASMVEGRGGKPTGLRWTIAESLPVHEDIKRKRGDYRAYIDRYKRGLENLAAEGVGIVCYNFMPGMDWTRTDLQVNLPDGAGTTRYDGLLIAAFDLHILKREGAERDYSPAAAKAAREAFDAMGGAARESLSRTILMGLPGTVDDLSLDDFREILAGYAMIDAETLRGNLNDFLEQVLPVCEERGIRMAIHPDDPPFPLFGLPRIMGTRADAERLFRDVPSDRSGLAFCSGSFGGRADNDCAAMFESLAPRVFFAHFRNLAYDEGRDDAFVESGQLEGRADMPRLMEALVEEEERRKAAGMAEWEIPVRPDHGKLFDRDRAYPYYPGYSFIGRAVGLAELRGLEAGIRSVRQRRPA